MSNLYRSYQFTLTNAKLDVRSAAADVAPAALRWLLNFETGKTGRFRPRRGFTRFLDRVPYNNEDLHDQLLDLQEYYEDIAPKPIDADNVRAWPNTLCASTPNYRWIKADPAQGIHEQHGREPICHLREIISTNGARKLLAFTRSRIYQLNEPTGNWRVLADGYSGSEHSTARTWQTGQIKNLVFATNDYDQPCVLDMNDDAPRGCAMRSTRPLGELNLIGCSKAAVLCCFKNVIFLANVELDNGRVENQIVWSDVVRFDDLTQTTPIRFSNASGSIAGDAQLSYGHRILAMLPLGNVLHVYTTRGIWRGTATGDAAAAFNFECIYESDAGDQCLAYPNAIISTGDAHWYLSREGHIYKIDPYSPTPERLVWLANAGDLIAQTIDQENCQGHVAGYDAQNGEVLFSWVERGESKPRRTFAFVPKVESGSYLDVGFTSFCNFTSDQRLSFRDFLRQEGICGNDALKDLFLKEGMPADIEDLPAPHCLFTHDTIDVVQPDGTTITTEDYEHGTLAADSLCALLGDRTADDYCQQCNEDQLFVAACAEDDCLKTLNAGYAREICTNATTGIGESTDFGYESFAGIYDARGYLREFITGPLVIGPDPTQAKAVNALLVEAEAETTAARPAWMGLQIGVSYTAADPLPEKGCGPVWSETVAREFKCLLAKLPDAYREQVIAPAIGLEAPFARQGRFIYARVTLGAKDGKRIVAGTGGGGALSYFILKVRGAQE